ncbi:MAG: hypothetical protein FJ388_22060, partial [Verrucomicrobia bacterium]|nr:hypothetical protein [Verrucomicrobiota bacterium]
KAPSLDKSKTSPLDRRGFNLAVMPFSTFRLLGALVDRGGKRDGRFVAMPLFKFNKFDEAGWHDAIVRVQGRRTELFVDGKLRDRRDVPAVYAQESSFFPEPAARTSSWCGIGADPGGRCPFRGAVDHVAIWHRALDDREIAALSGGKLNASWDLPTGWAQLATLPRSMSLADRNRWIDAQMERALPEMATRDPWFPKYHVAIPGDSYNFVTFYHRGLYHFFPIFNFGWWGTLLMSDGCAWAHLVSDDLLHWKLLPQLPKESFGANGCIAAQGDEATVFAGWGPDSLARPTRHGMHYLRSRDADLRSWTSDPANPVVMPDPPDWHGEDCTVLREGDEWWMIASSAKPNKQGRRSKQMHLFTSPALRDWKYAGVFFEVEADFAPECVHAFRLGGKLVLAGCQRMRRDLQYYVGRVENRRFIPETHGLWNHSAAEGIPTAVWTVEDNQGRRILWQWMEGRHFFNIGNLSVKERFKAGWDQAYSVPMLVSQRDDGTLALAPVPELE